MRRRIRLMAAALTALLAVCSAGCGSTAPVTIELNFPSMLTFLYAEFARIQVFELEDAEIGECPRILGLAMGGTPASDAYLDTNDIPVCDFRSGGVAFDRIETGPKAYVALVWDASNTLLLGGCTVAEVYEDAPAVRMSLHMSDQYANAVERINDGDGPLYVDERDKCEGGQ